MLEMVVFAITLVVAQSLAGLIIMKVFMNKRFIKKYAKMTAKVAKEIEDEMWDSED